MHREACDFVNVSDVLKKTAVRKECELHTGQYSGPFIAGVTF